MAVFGELVQNATDLRWMGTPVGGANQLAATLANIVFSSPIRLLSVDQIAIEYNQITKAAGSTTLRVQWGTELTITSVATSPWIFETAMSVAITAGVATYTAGASEWTITGAGSLKILLPAVAHFCRIGLYASAVGGTDDIRASVTCLSGGNTQR